MTELLVVGAGGLAREALAVVREDGVHRDVAVLDDDPRTWGSRLGGTPVVGGVEQVVEHPEAEVLVCVGRGAARRALVDRLSGLGVDAPRYATLVHPGVGVPDGCEVGRGSIVLAGVVLTADVVVGAHVVLMPHVTLTHDGVVGDHATLCAGATLGGGVRVGTGAYVGMNASVRQGVVLGADSVLGMGAVALHDVPPGEVWAGTPAHRLAPTLEQVAAR